MASGAVLEFEQHIAGGPRAAAGFPNLRRLERGHEHFERARAVHLFADDALLDIEPVESVFQSPAHRFDPFEEARLLGVAHRYQQATDWHKRMPGGIA